MLLTESQLDGKKSNVFVMEEGMPNVDDRQDDEVEETTTVLLSLIDFGFKEFGDDQVSVTSENYKLF